MVEGLPRGEEIAFGGQATSSEVSDLRSENEQLKQAVAELLLKNRVLEKSVTGSDSGWDD